MIALGDELGADQEIDLLALDRADKRGGARGRPDGVRGDDGGARLGKKLDDLFGDALDAGATGDELVLLAATGTGLGRRRHPAAMMALQAARQSVLDEPGGALRAFDALAAGTAQGQRRIAAPVEE